ncbi:hypothetical protein ACLOJK_039502 [Asimina triloba]
MVAILDMSWMPKGIYPDTCSHISRRWGDDRPLQRQAPFCLSKSSPNLPPPGKPSTVIVFAKPAALSSKAAGRSGGSGGKLGRVAEAAMAMGVSTPSGPFKPFWFSTPSIRRPSSVAAPLLSHASSFGPGSGVQRQETRSLHSADDCTSAANASGLSRLKHLTHGKEHGVSSFGNSDDHCHNTLNYRLYSRHSQASNGAVRNFNPPLNFGWVIDGNRIRSNEQMVPSTDDLSRWTVNDYINASKSWNEETIKVRESKESYGRCCIGNNKVAPEVPQVAAVCKQDKVASTRVGVALPTRDGVRSLVRQQNDSYLLKTGYATQGGESYSPAANGGTTAVQVYGNEASLGTQLIIDEGQSSHSALGVTGNNSMAAKHIAGKEEWTNVAEKLVHPNGASLQRQLDVELDPSRALNMRSGDAVESRGSRDDSDMPEDTHIVEVNSGIRNQQKEQLTHIYDKVLVVDDISTAKIVVEELTTKYNSLVHACDTEACSQVVAMIDVKEETPVGHGQIICFSIYSGPNVDFGNGKNCIWVDVLDGGQDLLMEFAPFFEDPFIKKVWHNYSFDCHILGNHGIKVSGFHADTMHLARLWDSSRRTEGGYSLEALTGNPVVMSGVQPQHRGEHTAGNRSTKSVSGKKKLRKDEVEHNSSLVGESERKDPESMSGAQLHNLGELIAGKISMKSIFGKKKLKKDGTEGKIATIPPVEELQRKDRIPWICYSALDSVSTLRLFESLKAKLCAMTWNFDGHHKGTMFDFYEEYWRPFGQVLVEMEGQGMLVDRAFLAEIEKVAMFEQEVAADRFRKWAAKHCPDAKLMNVGSDTQLRQLFFGGVLNRYRVFLLHESSQLELRESTCHAKNANETLPVEKFFRVLNVDKVIEEGKKVPTKFRNIKIHKIGSKMETDLYTPSGWPSLSGDALKAFAGKISAEYDWVDDVEDFSLVDDNENLTEQIVNKTKKRESPATASEDTSAYGTAYAAFGGGKEGREACHAIAALCEVPFSYSMVRLNQPALEKDRYKIRKAFVAEPGNSLIVADYGQLELRILAHLANCKSMLKAFKAGGDFHSRTAMNMYPYIREAVEEKKVLLEWEPQPGEEKPPVPLLKDAFASERRKAKMLNFSIAYGKTPVGLSRDWKVSVEEAKKTVDLWYKERKEVLCWQKQQKKEAYETQCVHTLLGRARRFPSLTNASNSLRGHIERAAINTPVQGSAADVAMCAMLEISRNARLKELGWRLILQVHDEVILEGPTESAEVGKAIVVECMSKPFYGTNFLKVDLAVDAKCAQNCCDCMMLEVAKDIVAGWHAFVTLCS